MLHDLQQPNLNCSKCWRNVHEKKYAKPPCAAALCVASHLMHDTFTNWILLYNLASAYENETVHIYKLAGAKGADFELLAMLKGVHRAYERSAMEQKNSVPNVPTVKR
jgi:NADPH-dependent curcumin reductase CurA